MITLKVLHLDGHFPDWVSRHMRKAGIQLEVTSETSADAMADGHYIVSRRSLELAAAATPELYDVVLLGNNRGVGFEKAAALPESMFDRTLVMWNRYHPGDEAAYAAFGFTHFGQRSVLAGERECPSIVSFLRQIAGQLSPLP